MNHVPERSNSAFEEIAYKRRCAALLSTDAAPQRGS